VYPIKEFRLCTGAEYLVVMMGNIITLPGLPKVPAAEHIDINSDGDIIGLS
jgi:formate--tetrahydrofolate ligase